MADLKNSFGALGAGWPNGFNKPLDTRIGISCGVRPSTPAASTADSRCGMCFKFKKRSKSGFIRPPQMLMPRLWPRWLEFDCSTD